MASCRFRTLLALSLALAFLLLATPLPALAWGKAGHRVVATLATSFLTLEAQRKVADLLGPGVSLAQISTWADEVRTTRPNTGPWHYVNIPRGANEY